MPKSGATLNLLPRRNYPLFLNITLFFRPFIALEFHDNYPMRNIDSLRKIQHYHLNLEYLLVMGCNDFMQASCISARILAG